MANWTIEYQYTAMLITAMFILGLVMLFGVNLIAWRTKEGLSDRYIKLIVIILVVIVAMSVSVSGFGQQTTNSVLGLIGTIVGYLLGRTDQKNTK